MGQMVIEVIYDNRKDNEIMQEGWGFCCLVDLGHRIRKQQDLQDRKRHDGQDILSILPLAIVQILLLSKIKNRFNFRCPVLELQT